MHNSRLSGFIIDCDTQDLEGAARFWGAALGLKVEASAEAGEALYRRLGSAGTMRCDIEVQQVSHPSRVHLDIELDRCRGRGAAPGAAWRQARKRGPGLVRNGGPHRPALLRGARPARATSPPLPANTWDE